MDPYWGQSSEKLLPNQERELGPLLTLSKYLKIRPARAQPNALSLDFKWKFAEKISSYLLSIGVRINSKSLTGYLSSREYSLSIYFMFLVGKREGGADQNVVPSQFG